jgi:hypothetical protein
MAGRFVVQNGGKICGEKWREDLWREMAGRFVMRNGGKVGVRNGGKIWAGKWGEDGFCLHEMCVI